MSRCCSTRSTATSRCSTASATSACPRAAASTRSTAAAASTRRPTSRYARTHGGGYRAIYDLADPDKSRFVIATGESGHIFSPHYRDLAPLWIDGKSITLAGDEDALKRAGAQELTFTPH